MTLEWVVIARDIRNRKLSIASRGSRQIDIPADEEMEVTSSPYSFSKKDGEVRELRENRFRPDRPQFDVEPDSGTRYAGFQICCCHWSCVQCPPCCANCFCCKEEILVRPIHPLPRTHQ